jgi:hypothetical protein
VAQLFSLGGFARMKKKAKNQQQPSKLVSICYDGRAQGWVIKGKHKPVFTAQIDLENYCRNKLGLIPVTTDPDSRRPVRKFYQQLPHCSVWTGAPWDRTFAK